jgi:hypothetical protein
MAGVKLAVEINAAVPTAAATLIFRRFMVVPPILFG